MADGDLQSSRALTREGVEALYAILQAIEALTTAVGAQTDAIEALAPTSVGVSTVAGLPTVAAAGQGARRMVTDANATTFASIVAGGGANIVPVFNDGTNWRIG